MINGNYKDTALIGYTATKKCAVSRVENRNVSVCNGLALFIYDGTRQMEVGLVDALHGNHTIGLGDAHGIEAYYLMDSIGQGGAMKRGGDTEIFKFVVDETNLVTA